MGSGVFKTTIFGGVGNLNISFDQVPDQLSLGETNPGPLTVILPQGVNNYTEVGVLPPGGTIGYSA
jgi:hypothetical protein